MAIQLQSFLQIPDYSILTRFVPLLHILSPLQKRITITGRVINNADNVNFLVTGKKKADIVEKILKKEPDAQNFPASQIVPVYGELFWFLDKESASLL